MADEIDIVSELYERFNARDIEALLSTMSDDVVWANGMEGGHVHGREGVRSYWTRQWTMIDPRVEPTGFSISDSGEIVVDVHQVVYDLAGRLLKDTKVRHVFRIESGLIRRFDIRPADQ